MRHRNEDTTSMSGSRRSPVASGNPWLMVFRNNAYWPQIPHIGVHSTQMKGCLRRSSQVSTFECLPFSGQVCRLTGRYQLVVLLRESAYGQTLTAQKTFLSNMKESQNRTVHHERSEETLRKHVDESCEYNKCNVQCRHTYANISCLVL